MEAVGLGRLMWQGVSNVNGLRLSIPTTMFHLPWYYHEVGVLKMCALKCVTTVCGFLCCFFHLEPVHR